MKYVSIDIETTGLDPNKHDIVEFAAVLDATEYSIPVEQLPFFRAVIVTDNYNVSPYCGHLHFDLWKEICVVDKTRMADEGHYLGSYMHVETHYTKPEYLIMLFVEWLEKHGIEGRINPVGKNFGAFDLHFLNRLEGAKDLPLKHRTLDPGCMYATATDEQIPSLEECLKRAGRTPDALHTALGDARDVVRLIRHKLKPEYNARKEDFPQEPRINQEFEKSKNIPQYVLFEPSKVGMDKGLAGALIDAQNMKVPLAIYSGMLLTNRKIVIDACVVAGIDLITLPTGKDS